MELKHFKLNALALEEEGFFANPREFINQKLIRELADSIEAHGLHYALRGIERADGKVVVVDGGRRLRAIRLLVEEKRANGLADKVPVTIIEGKLDADGARVQALIGNLQREELSSYEVAKELCALKDAGLSQSDIAKRLNKSQSWVSRHLSSFTKSAPAVHKAWAAGKLPDDDVQSLSKLPAPEQEKRLADMMQHRDAAAVAKPGKKRAQQAAARAVVKGDKKKPAAAEAPEPSASSIRPGSATLTRLRDLTGQAAKGKRYIAGLHDAFKFILGELAMSEFDKEFTSWAEAKVKSKALPSAPKKAASKKASK